MRGIRRNWCCAFDRASLTCVMTWLVSQEFSLLVDAGRTIGGWLVLAAEDVVGNDDWAARTTPMGSCQTRNKILKLNCLLLSENPLTTIKRVRCFRKADDDSWHHGRTHTS